MFQRNMFDSHNPLDIIQNTPENELGKIRDDDGESKSGSENLEGGSGDEQDPNQRPKKKRYHRHTQHQIQEMESFFKECPHPDDKQRKELSRELSLEPLQVKFWFQNKRTQMKTQQERHENSQLRAENDKLRSENMRYKEALASATCPTCGGPTVIDEMTFDEQNLRVENVRLREEIDRISGIAAKYIGKPITPYPLMPTQGAPRGLDLSVGNYGMQPAMGGDMYGGGVDVLRSVTGPHEQDKPLIVELAVAATDELVRMAQLGEPLWERSLEYGHEALNEDEYMRLFPRGIGPKPPHYKSESSRDSGIVIMNTMTIVEILMDVSQWTTMFSSIVSRAMTLEVLSTGIAGNCNGALQVMTAEYQVPSPLVPTRESFFLRYSKKHAEGMWTVVDVSLDHLRGQSMRCRRRPSGCVIQECQNGYSKVIWIEHVEVDERETHNLYKQVVNTSLGFGARRWISTLDRQSERFQSALVNNLPAGDTGAITNIEGRKSLLRLAERMVTSFCNGVCASTAHNWTALSGASGEDVRVMTRKSVDDPGRPAGIVLSAATSFWLPVQPKKLFDFLRDENSRAEWDILSNGGAVQEMAHVANGRDPGNSVSLLRVNSHNSNQSNMLILQESSMDAAAGFVIYAPVDVAAMNLVLQGGDPDYVALLPSGFAILPDGQTINRVGAGEMGVTGSLLTVAFQILVDSAPSAKLSLGSVATVNNLISCTVDRIKNSIVVGKPEYNV